MAKSERPRFDAHLERGLRFDATLLKEGSGAAGHRSAMSASVASQSRVAVRMSAASRVDTPGFESTKYSPDVPDHLSSSVSASAVLAPPGMDLALRMVMGTTTSRNGFCHSGALATMCLPRSVLTSPGHSEFTVTVDPRSFSRRASSRAKRMFAALV